MSECNKGLFYALIATWRQLCYKCQYILIKLCKGTQSSVLQNTLAVLLLMDISKVFDCQPHDLMATNSTAYSVFPQ